MATATVTAPPFVASDPPRTATHASPPRQAITGVWIGIATISMSFAALTSALVVRQSGAPDWQRFQLPTLLYFNTLMLVLSSVSVEAARRRRSTSVVGLYVTLALGALFVVGQVLAWRQLAAQGLFLATSPSSSFFYVFTALHGLHLLGGLAGLLYVLRRLHRAGDDAAWVAVRAMAIYWHFMAALWVFLFSMLALRI